MIVTLVVGIVWHCMSYQNVVVNDQTFPWISNMDLILINPVPLSIATFLLYECMQMCHFWNRTTAPSNPCNFCFRYRIIFYEVSNCAELPDASANIKHSNNVCFYLKLKLTFSLIQNEDKSRRNWWYLHLISSKFCLVSPTKSAIAKLQILFFHGLTVLHACFFFFSTHKISVQIPKQGFNDDSSRKPTC